MALVPASSRSGSVSLPLNLGTGAFRLDASGDLISSPNDNTVDHLWELNAPAGFRANGGGDLLEFIDENGALVFLVSDFGEMQLKGRGGAEGSLQIQREASNDQIVLDTLQGITVRHAAGVAFHQYLEITNDTGNAKILFIDSDAKIGFFNHATTAQPAAIADAAGGAVQDAQARTAVNAVLAALRAFGLIAT